MNQKRKFIILLVILILIDAGIYFLGHFLLAGIYEGRFLKWIIEGQSQHSLTFYLQLFDRFFLISNGLGWTVIFYTKIIIGDNVGQITDCIKSDIRTLVAWVKNNKSIFTIGFCLAIIFFVLYFYVGLQFGKTPAFSEEDLIFGIDARRTLTDNADFSSLHNRTLVHPLYILLINPLGSAINMVLNNVLISGLMVNALFASFGIYLVTIIFYLLSKATLNTVILTTFYGVSMSHLCIGIFPDTMAVAVCSLLLNYLLFLVCILNKRTYLIAWIPVGILTLGITVTNFIQTLICLFLVIFYFEEKRTNIVFWIRTLSSSIVPVILLAAILAVVQKIIWSEAELFFIPQKYGSEMVYVKSTILNSPVTVIKGLLKNYYLFNFIGPIPEIYQEAGRANSLIVFQSAFQFLKIGHIAICLWMVGMILTIKEVFKTKKDNKFYIGALFCNLFVLLLHSIYGANEMFLYTGTITFLLCTYLVLLFDLQNFRARFYFLVFIPVVFLNNILILMRMLAVFQ